MDWADEIAAEIANSTNVQSLADYDALKEAMAQHARPRYAASATE